MSENNLGAKFAYLLAGVTVGALVGLLFAPGSGEETRKYLSQKAEESRQFAQRKARELGERASAAIDAGKEAYQREMARPQSG
jgi:gas vesicle protein